MNDWENLLKDHASTNCGYIAAHKKKWAELELTPDLGRSAPSPINEFYDKAHELCAQSKELLETPDGKNRKESNIEDEYKLFEVEDGNNRKFIKDIIDLRNDIISILKKNISGKDKKEKFTKKYKTFSNKYQDPKTIYVLEEFSRLDQYKGRADLFVDTATDIIKDFRREQSGQFDVLKQISLSLGSKLNTGPSESDWEDLGKHFKSEFDQCSVNKKNKEKNCHGNWCSLIYSYWLDEAGLPWAVERLADRIENGIVKTTQPLQAIRINEGSTAATVINKFTAIWQQGDLAAVDERRRQYQAVYGFPLFSASLWGRLDTIDSHHSFPSAFHRFLAETMRYQKDSRNLQIKPDIQPVISAFNTLSDALHVGNENLRRVRTPELRGQMEYCKQILGGYTKHTDLDKEWKSRLPGRPGLQDTLEPWQFSVDAVAGLYSWKRPGIRDYVTLAEHGEQILIFSRVLARYDGPIGEGMMRAYIAMMENSLNAYVNAYKTVTRIDLARKPFYGAPAEAMLRFMQPPVVPPLRRSWAAEVPLSA